MNNDKLNLNEYHAAATHVWEVVILLNTNRIGQSGAGHADASLAWELKYQVWLLMNIASDDTTMLESTKTQIRGVAEKIDDICIRSLS